MTKVCLSKFMKCLSVIFVCLSLAVSGNAQTQGAPINLNEVNQKILAWSHSQPADLYRASKYQITQVLAALYDAYSPWKHAQNSKGQCRPVLISQGPLVEKNLLDANTPYWLAELAHKVFVRGQDIDQATLKRLYRTYEALVAFHTERNKNFTYIPFLSLRGPTMIGAPFLRYQLLKTLVDTKPFLDLDDISFVFELSEFSNMNVKRSPTTNTWTSTFKVAMSYDMTPGDSQFRKQVSVYFKDIDYDGKNPNPRLIQLFMTMMQLQDSLRKIEFLRAKMENIIVSLDILKKQEPSLAKQLTQVTEYLHDELPAHSLYGALLTGRELHFKPTRIGNAIVAIVNAQNAVAQILRSYKREGSAGPSSVPPSQNKETDRSGNINAPKGASPLSTKISQSLSQKNQQSVGKSMGRPLGKTVTKFQETARQKHEDEESNYIRNGILIFDPSYFFMHPELMLINDRHPLAFFYALGAMNHLNQVRDQGSHHSTDETPVAGTQALMPSMTTDPANDVPQNQNIQGSEWTPEVLRSEPTGNSPNAVDTFISSDSDLSRQWDEMIREERGHRPSDSQNIRGYSDDNRGNNKQDEPQNWLNQPESTPDNPIDSKNSGYSS